VLITDAGYAITFGGGNSQSGQHSPRVFTLEQYHAQKSASSSSSTPSHDSSSPAPTWRPPAYRIRKIVFGLGHAIALVNDKGRGGGKGAKRQ
jgi:hypothetical protein